MTHRDACRAAAGWLLRGRNCYASAWEVGVASGGQYDAIGVTVPDPAGDVVVRCREYDIARAGAVRKQEARALRERGEAAIGPLFGGLVPPSSYTEHRIAAAGKRVGRPRIEVAECKVSRSDWLSDVRAQKLRRYEPAASHAWLCCGSSDVGTLEQLVADGLPDGWGVVLLTEPYATVLRDATPLREVEAWEVTTLAGIMLHSLSWRGTGSGPVGDELAGEAS